MIRSETTGGRRLELTLFYDTAAQPLAAGVRAVIQRARRLLYSADDTELVLQISPEPTPNRLRLIGQILDEGLPVEAAGVHLDGLAESAHTTDEEGEFRVIELPARAYRLTIDLADGRVGVTPLDIH